MNGANSFSAGGGGSFGQPSKIMEEVMLNGNIPVAGPGRTGMMGGGGGVVPPILLDESRVPKFYLEAIAACGATQSHMLPHTALVYNLMVTSGLPRPVLSYVWSAVNRSLPGQLTRPEFFSSLALIALAQKGESLAALSTMSSLPIPHLSNTQVPIQPPTVSAPMVNIARPASNMNPVPTRPVKTHPSQSTSSSFIPTSLLPLKTSDKKSLNTDLMGDVILPTTVSEVHKPASALLFDISPPLSAVNVQTSSSASISTSLNKDEPKATAPNYDLSDVDWSAASTFNDCSGEQRSFNSSTTSQSSTSSATKPLPSATDKHREECWKKVLETAAKLFAVSQSLLSIASDDVLEELVGTEKGESYIRCLELLHSIVERVERSASDRLDADSVKRIRECEKAWKRVARFAPKDSELQKQNMNSSGGMRSCGVCCVATDRSVDYGGQSYHPECANLWVNNIDPLLPNLHLR